MGRRIEAAAPRPAHRSGRRHRQARAAQPSRNWRAILGLRRADALWLRDRIIPCAVLVAVSGAFAFALRSPLFVVRTVRVAGSPAALTTQIVRSAGINNQSLFALNPRQLEGRILTIPDLRQANVRLDLPNALTITVQAYQAAVVWVSAGKPYLVTSDGTVIKPGDDPQLLHVTSGAPMTYRHGDQIALTQVRAAFALRDLLSSQQIAATNYTFLDAHSLRVQSPGGWQAIFDVTGDVGQQSRILSALLARGVPFHLVDLRYGDEPFYR